MGLCHKQLCLPSYDKIELTQEVWTISQMAPLKPPPPPPKKHPHNKEKDERCWSTY